MQRHITQKDGASITPAHAKVARSSDGSLVTGQVLADLNRVKALFQMRALATAMGCPSIIRDVDGDGLMLTVDPLKFIPIASGRNPQAGARVDTPSGSSANNLNILSHG